MKKKGTFGERIAQGLRDAIAYESDEDIKMRVYEVDVPDPPPDYTAQAVQRATSKRAASPKSVTVPAMKVPTKKTKQSAPAARRATGSASSLRARVKGKKR